ncbi:hydrogenase expression/formation protein HypE [Shewanella yunxiaonensis]|uniref:Hydrogenase expression/formation protein HypE n=1 Tax=Shewanella yunxiaonensis TaxID=2829809 RepID=A0ABX7YY85_9GAMM|nr:hydrogenase expression/formation protein HypE [Shewanella yunxiaonensis]QUN07418.1 hydrogenase expression/formation protein HypE [Shewanella yunxiaonensis]
MSTPKQIQLSHGGGGREMAELIGKLFFEAFDNQILRQEEDAACLNMTGPIAFTTDSFVVSPLFFKGGNIGKLAIAGTVNDLAMMGAAPQYLSCGFIIEEGFEIAKLKEIVETMAAELHKSGAKIVCGDTKVVPKGCADGVFINTSGVGRIIKPGISVHSVRPGDAIILSRDIGCHGAAILAAREGLELETELQSDCATLWPMVEQLIAANLELHAMRDATRGGIAAVLNEWAKAANVGIELSEEVIPVRDEVRGVCELYGFEPWDLANEGTFVIALPQEIAADAITVMHQFCNCDQARIVGTVTDTNAGKVILHSPWGSKRYLELPAGELLPRIC